MQISYFWLRHVAVAAPKKLQLKRSQAAQNNTRDNLPFTPHQPPPCTTLCLPHASKKVKQGAKQSAQRGEQPNLMPTKCFYWHQCECACVWVGGRLWRGACHSPVRLHIFAAFVNIFLYFSSCNDFAAKLKCIRNLHFDARAICILAFFLIPFPYTLPPAHPTHSLCSTMLYVLTSQHMLLVNKTYRIFYAHSRQHWKHILARKMRGLFLRHFFRLYKRIEKGSERKQYEHFAHWVFLNFGYLY